jgi:hypothetical protein
MAAKSAFGIMKEGDGCVEEEGQMKPESSHFWIRVENGFKIGGEHYTDEVIVLQVSFK